MKATRLQAHVQNMLEEHFSYEEDLSQEYVLEQEYQSEEHVSEDEDLPVELDLDEDLSEEHDSEEYLLEEQDSEEEDMLNEHDSEEYLLEEHDSEEYLLEEPDSEEEDMSDEHDSEEVDFVDVVGYSEEADFVDVIGYSEEEDMSEDVDVVGYSEEENMSEDVDVVGFSKENDSEKEDLPKKHPYKEKNWLERYYFNENWLTKHGFGKNWERLSISYENRVKEHGFVFKNQTVATKECVVEIVIVGKENCGKTQLIETVFGDHPSLTVTNHETRNEYRIHLSENLSFHVWIYDVKDIEFVKKSYFRYKTVFIFCFAYGDPESLAHIQKIWIPLLSQKPMIRMFHFLVGIERDLVSKHKAIAGINKWEYKQSMREKADVLLSQLQTIVLTECSTEDKKSMVKVFQSAFGAVYPCITGFK